MNLIPLIWVELQVARRRPRTRRTLLGCAIGAAAVAMWMLSVWSAWQSAASMGTQFFRAIGLIGFAGALLAGLVRSADSISKEKRDGTLPLLFLTDISAPDVVLGKLCAKAVVPFYALMALFPTLMISVVLGGNTPGEFAGLYLVWANALFFALALSLTISTYCWEQRTANLLALFSILLFTVGAPWAAWRLTAATGLPTLGGFLYAVSPAAPLQLALNHHSSAGLLIFWFATNQVLAWALVALAIWRVHRFRNGNLDWSAAPNKRRLAQTEEMVRRSYPARELLDEHPIEWRVSHAIGRPRGRTLLFLLLASFFLILPVDPFGSTSALNGFLLFVACQTAVKLWIGAQAAYAFYDDRRSGALESLLGTRMDVDEITRGVFRSFYSRFKGPVLLFCLLALVLSLRLLGGGRWTSALLLLVSGVALFWDGYCSFWVGLWQGLVARTPALGTLGTAGRIIVLPWVWFLAARTVYWRSTAVEFLMLWTILFLFNHLAFLILVKGSFRRYFRTLALKPFGEKNPRIENDWSPINWDADAEQEPEQAG